MKGIAYIVIDMHELTGVLVGATSIPYGGAFPPDIEIISVEQEGTQLKFTVTSIEFSTDEGAIYSMFDNVFFAGEVAEA